MKKYKCLVVLLFLLNVTLAESITNQRHSLPKNNASISHRSEPKALQYHYQNPCPMFSLTFYTLNEDAENTMLSHLMEWDFQDSQIIKSLRVAAFKFTTLLNGSEEINCIDRVQNFAIRQLRNNSSKDTLKFLAQIRKINCNKVVQSLNPYSFLECSFNLCNLASAYNSSSWIQDHCLRKTPK